MRNNHQALVVAPLIALLLLSCPAPGAASNLKSSPDGTPVDQSGLIVTGVFSGFLYVEAPDRSWGIRVELASPAVKSGQTLRVTGTIGTSSEGERFIGSAQVTPEGYESVGALRMTVKALGGSSWSYSALNGAGQQGTRNGAGLNNIGLLVKILGRVTASGPGYITVDDGSELATDTPGVTGVKVVLPEGAEPLQPGMTAVVIGISSCYRSGGYVYSRVLLVPSLF